MVTYRIEDVHSITVDISIHEVEINLSDRLGSTARIEMSRDDAEYMHEKLGEALRRI